MESQPLDDYPSGPHDVFVLIQYHLHVEYHMFEGVVRFYNFNFFVLCFRCKWKAMFIFIYVNLTKLYG